MSSNRLLLLRRRGGSWIKSNAIAGTWTLVEDDGSFTADGNDYTFPAQTTPTWGDLGAHFDAQTRAAGLALYVPLALSTWEECGAGWHTAADSVDPDSMEHAIQANATDGQLDTEVPVAAIVTGLTSAEFKTLQVLRDTGCFYIVDGKLRWVSETGSTATLYPAFSNLDAVGTWGETNTSVAQIADYNPAWGGDWSGVTDTKTNPANEATFNSTGDVHFQASFTVEDTKAVFFYIRYTDSSNFTRLGISAARAVSLRNNVSGSGETVFTGAALTDGVSYVWDLILNGLDYSLYQDKALIASGTFSAAGNENITGGYVLTDLATNDIVLTTHPYPALGIATSRVVCPQQADTATHTADCVIEFKNVTLPSSGLDQISIRRTDANNEERLYFADDGGLDYYSVVSGSSTRHINTGAGTVSNGDDVVLVLDGVNAQLFVAGASIGTTANAGNLTATGLNVVDTNGGMVLDHVACFPRDVSSLLPKGTY